MPKSKKKTTVSLRKHPMQSPKPFFYFWVGFIGFIVLCSIFYLVSVYGNKHAVDIGLLSEDTSAFHAATLAVDQVNASGGILVNGTRFPVKLTVRESKTVEEAKSGAQSLIDEGVLAIIGPSASATATVAHDIAKGEGILLLPTVCGDTCDDSVVSSPLKTSETDVFIEAYQKRYKVSANTQAVVTYNTLQTLFSTIKENGSLDRLGLLQAAGQ